MVFSGIKYKRIPYVILARPYDFYDIYDNYQAAQSIISPVMGRDRIRGKIYIWVPTPLVDGKRQINSRSLLFAINPYLSPHAMGDHRLNSSDLFRVVAGIARKEGARALRQGEVSGLFQNT